jgi:hypothetical protein
MLRSTCFTALLSICLLASIANTAQAGSFHFTVIAPGMIAQPMYPAPGHWECISYNPWEGMCNQYTFVRPVVYGPYPYAAYEVRHHHHRYWG